MRRLTAVVLTYATVGAGCSPTGGSGGTAELAHRPPISVDVAGTPQPIDPHVLGTNLPAWIGPERLADDAFRAEIIASGTTMLRMPGGSWSNDYDWLSCELDDEAGCFATWAAAPSDFADVLDATGLDGMWTVAFNQTAESAAALVAFFNGSVDDRTPIGVDRDGTDWETVGTWASLRSDRGHPDPIRIEHWEIGNEVFGARPDTGGSDCASFGWEHVWTCQGDEYVLGDDEHDGFEDFRRAMKRVDPTIEIGAVGVADPSAWGDWSTEVLEASGGNFDFFILHDYGFSESPGSVDAVGRPAEAWPGLISTTREMLADGTPIAVTEYNLISFEGGDDRGTMKTALNALYIAETIGQLVIADVPIATQWNFANGTTESGTDYGMLSLDGEGRLPQFHAMAAWAQAGEFLHSVPASDDSTRIYPTTRANGELIIVALSFDDRPTSRVVELQGVGTWTSGTVTSVHADDHTSTDMTTSPPRRIDVSGSQFELLLPPWSISVIEIGTPV
ncbi:MAG: alpha-L-arabinofuranosidase [Ilumatobacter sp.]|uniref:alpha-L-arabinofuranosidase n=1 Tax=Ilumatobacter sp. TaxID=1967498 RepID=UPI003297890D